MNHNMQSGPVFASTRTPAEIAVRLAEIDRHLAGGTLPAGLRAALKRERARLLAAQEGGQA